jgi:hypothetical protein
MKSYPSIEHAIQRDIDIYAFDKLDGSNIRAEWSQKKGFYKFGTRKRMLGEDDPDLGKSIGIIKSKYYEELDRIFRKNRYNREVTCFFEFFGPKSFAGQHDKNDDHTVVLIDVSPPLSGFVPPNEFIKTYGHLGIPNLLYYGKANREFEESVRNSTLNGMGLEGVVCKAPNPNRKKTSQPVMFKIKSFAWLKKVKELYGEKVLEEVS